MIYLVTGVPGSGKTYFAVHYIYEQLNSEKPQYKQIYTNINLNFKKCDSIKKDYVKPLILDDLLQRIQKDYELSELFKKNSLYDEETGELITDYDSYVRGKLKLFEPYEHSLIILDECHLYFTESTDPKMLRFLSYHRHFDIDMWLLTQNKSLINRKYLAFVENMYIGTNPSKRFFSKVFVYKLYASWKEYKSNYVGKEKLKFDKKIASCYNSGSTKIKKSFTARLLIPLLILAVVVIFAFIGFKNYLSTGSVFGSSSKKHVNIQKTLSTQSSDKSVIHHTSVIEDTYFLNTLKYRYSYKFDCFTIKCISHNLIIPKYLLFYLQKVKLIRILYKTSNTFFIFSKINLNKFSLLGANHEETNSSVFSFNKR